MKRVIFLLVMLSCFAVNAQKKPSVIRTYVYYQEPTPDVFFAMQRSFTYDVNGNLIREMIEDYQEDATTRVERVYDQSNRMVFLAAFNENSDTIRKEIRTYNAGNKVIEYVQYQNQSGTLSPVERTTFTGVTDMNEPEGKIGIEIFNDYYGLSYRNCTSVTTEIFAQDQWSPFLTIIPEYKTGRVHSLSVNINMDLPTEIPLDITVTFAYNVQNRLSKIDFNLALPALPIPISVIAIENSYENNLLVDSVISSSTALATFGIPPFSIWHQFTYNSDKSIAVIRQYTKNFNTEAWDITRADCYDCLLDVPESVKDELKLSPNPAQNKLQITTENEPISTVTVYDLVGKEVLNLSNMNDCKVDIDVQNLCSGYYVLKIKTSGSILTKKFIKQ